MQRWHRDLLLRRKGHNSETIDKYTNLSLISRKDPWTAEKYKEVIERLKNENIPVETIAKEYNFNPVTLRAYLKKHEPGLFSKNGIQQLDNGKKVLGRSYEKYKAAIEDLKLSGDNMKDVAIRNGLIYNSFAGFIRRNFPELIQSETK